MKRIRSCFIVILLNILILVLGCQSSGSYLTPYAPENSTIAQSAASTSAITVYKPTTVTQTNTIVIPAVATTTASSGGTAPDIKSHVVASMAGFCTSCHGNGFKFPAAHTGRTSELCLTCHKAAAGNS